jgi:arginyl-tRNA synthetase
VYLELQKRLGAASRGLKDKYDLQPENIPSGDSAGLAIWRTGHSDCFELARKLRKAPKVIAQEIVAALGIGRDSLL